MQPVTPATRASHTVSTAPEGRNRTQRLLNGETSSGGRPRGPQTLFSIRFQSSMTDAEAARLRGLLDLVTYLTPKPGVSSASLGVVRLDDWSGLFLERGAAEGEWILEGRTWDSPPESVLHGWSVRAALAARELDPTVQIPQPLRNEPVDPRAHLLDRAADKRSARIGRRTHGRRSARSVTALQRSRGH